MKKFLILFVVAILSVNFALAQLPPASKPDAELKKKEAVLRIADFKARVDNLTTELKSIEDQVNSAKNELEQIKAQYKDCRKTILALVGATDADVDAFRQKIGVLEGKVRQMKGLSNDALADRRDEVVALENELNQLRSNKISVLPEFYDKIIGIGRDIKGLYREKKITTYTVGTWAENRDCLWNIAGKIEIYSDPLLWVKIWQNNTDKIKNPDIIHPGQVLTIPTKADKTTEDQKAERRYWRNKRAAEEAAATAGEKVQ
jgi:nucleoid-associated protein YgaU